MTRRPIATGAAALAMSTVIVRAGRRRPASPAGTFGDSGGRQIRAAGGGRTGVSRAANGSRSPTAGRSSGAAMCSAARGASYGKVGQSRRAGLARRREQLDAAENRSASGDQRQDRARPGTYTMFIDLKPNNWTLIVSSWKAQTRYDPNNKAELWGAYDYTPDKDVVRAPMTLGDAAVVGRSADVGLRRHERRRRQAHDHVG